MSSVAFHSIDGYASSPVFSEIAVIPPGSSLVWIGGQNAVSPTREIVGEGDIALQATTIMKRIEAALSTVGCSWRDVVRMQVLMVVGADLQAAYSAFMPAFVGLVKPPLVGFHQVAALANPKFLLEVGVEAVKG